MPKGLFCLFFYIYDSLKNEISFFFSEICSIFVEVIHYNDKIKRNIISYGRYY